MQLGLSIPPLKFFSEQTDHDSISGVSHLLDVGCSQLQELKLVLLIKNVYILYCQLLCIVPNKAELCGISKSTVLSCVVIGAIAVVLLYVA